MPAQWSHFAHSADIGVRGEGPTLESAFEQAALALFAVITDLERIAARSAVDIACTAPTPALLLVDWLNALIFELTTRQTLFSRFEVHIEGQHLRGRAWGEPIDPGRHHPAVEPKGATLTELRVAPAPDGGWIVQCVVDV